MTWEVVARKDFQDAARSHWLWALSALFVAVLAFPPAILVADILPLGQGIEQLSTDAFVNLMRDTMTLLVPIIAIVLTYASITGERDSGTLKLLLSLPHSRRDVVVGKAFGRGAVIVLPVLAGFVVAAVVFLATPVTLNPGPFFGFALLSAVIGLVFVTISIGISAGARSSRASMVGTVGVYVLFTLLWNSFTNGIVRLLNEYAGLEGAARVKLHLFLKILNPTQAYKTLADTLIYTLPQDATIQHQVAVRARMVGPFQRLGYAQALGDNVPFYLSDPFIALLLIGWLVAAPAVGYYVFREADL